MLFLFVSIFTSFNWSDTLLYNALPQVLGYICSDLAGIDDIIQHLSVVPMYLPSHTQNAKEAKKRYLFRESKDIIIFLMLLCTTFDCNLFNSVQFLCVHFFTLHFLFCCCCCFAVVSKQKI